MEWLWIIVLLIALYWAFVYWPVTLVIGVVWFVVRFVRKQAAVSRAREEETERKRRREATERERETERKRQDVIRRAAERAQALAQVAELVYSAQEAVARLPIILAKAEFALDRAEQELADNVPSSFWEAMETSAQLLGNFDATIRLIDAALSRHASLAPPLKPNALDFSLGVSLLPDASRTAGRMNNLYRQAQRKVDGNFAMIYEQRRNTASMIQGFKSLGEAFTNLGDRLEAALGSLGDQVDFRLTDIESALRDSAESIAEQQSALLRVAQEARQEASQADADQARFALEAASRAEQHASSRRQYEADTLRMLDNIQHRRQSFSTGRSGVGL